MNPPPPHPSLMHGEILQTPALTATWANRVCRRPAWIKAVKTTPSLVVFIARGSSDHAALYGRYLLEATLGVPVVLAAPSLQTLLHERPTLPKGTLLIAVSQSGGSTDVTECFTRLQQPGTTALAITNTPESPLAQTAHAVCHLQAGPERSVAATKTYSLTLAALFALAGWLSGKNPSSALALAAEDMERFLRRRDNLEALAQRFTYAPQAVVLGRLYHYASAREFALKLTETCNIAATGASEADFQHGPISLLRRGYPAFVLATDGPSAPSTATMLHRMDTAATQPVLFTDHRPWLKGRAGFFVRRTAPPTLGPLVLAPAFQWFCACLSHLRGRNPDTPPNLEKITRTH